MKTPSLHRLLITCAALLFLGGHAQAQNIRIGFQAPLTGPAAADGNAHHTVIVLDVDGALEDDRELVELGLLRRLLPAFRREHLRDRHMVVTARCVADVLLDDLAPGNGDHRRCGDELGHVCLPVSRG